MNNYNLKSIRQQFKDNGVFYSTDKIANILKSYVDIDTNEVYEPTCGDGALLRVWNDDIVKYGQELNPQQLEIAINNLINFTGFCGNTLTNPNPEWRDKKFKCIVANYPFSIKWQPELISGDDERFNLCPVLPPQSKADYAFILHIIHSLDNDGIAVVLCFPGILYRGNAEGKIRKWIIEQNYIEKVIRIPGNEFVDTKIETVILVLKKNKTTTDITFIDHHTKEQITVGIDKIIKNDYNLSVSSYIIKEVIKEYIDPIALQKQARDATIEQLKQDLRMDAMVCDFENFDFNEYLDKIQNLINDFRTYNKYKT